MSDYSELIARAERVQDGATEGPWTWDGDTFSDAPEHKCPHGTQWCDHGPDLVRGNPDGSTFKEFDADNLVITSNGYDASSLEVKTADAEFITAARTLVPELVSALKEAQERLREADELLDAVAEVADNYRLIEDTQILEILRPTEDDTP